MSSYQFRHRVIQALRRLTQFAVVVLVFGLIFLGLYHHYHASRTLDDIASVKGWRGVVLSLVDDGVSATDDPETFLERNNGNLWSMRVAGVEIADPLAFVEATAATRRLHAPLLLSILLPVLLTVLLGRVFCSWICPGYVLFEIAGKLRKLLARAGVEPPAVPFSFTNKYLLLAAGTLVALVTALPIFSMFYPPALLSRVAHAVIFGSALTGMLTIVCAIVAFEVTVSPRWWCRTMCPGGALYALLGARRVLRVELLQDACSNCGLCHPACEAGLNVLKESGGIECDNCAACLRHCPDKALAFKLRAVSSA